MQAKPPKKMSPTVYVISLLFSPCVWPVYPCRNQYTNMLCYTALQIIHLANSSKYKYIQSFEQQKTDGVLGDGLVPLLAINSESAFELCYWIGHFKWFDPFETSKTSTGVLKCWHLRKVTAFNGYISMKSILIMKWCETVDRQAHFLPKHSGHLRMFCHFINFNVSIYVL